MKNLPLTNMNNSMKCMEYKDNTLPLEILNKMEWWKEKIGLYKKWKEQC